MAELGGGDGVKKGHFPWCYRIVLLTEKLNMLFFSLNNSTMEDLTAEN